jgi:hypothetical protein
MCTRQHRPPLLGAGSVCRRPAAFARLPQLRVDAVCEQRQVSATSDSAARRTPGGPSRRAADRRRLSLRGAIWRDRFTQAAMTRTPNVLRLSDAASALASVAGLPREGFGPGDGYSMYAMSWGEIELEPEVRDWYLNLAEEEQARVRFHIDRLAEEGPLLDEPHTRQLAGKLRELRFFLAGQPTRVTYWIAPQRRIVLLTVFAKTRPRERREVERATRAMERCLAEGHTAGEE